MDRNEAIEICKLLSNLIEFTQVEKILSSFIPAFYSQSIQKEDGYWYLHSNFRLGGTVSGRMSSPLLMTIPSNSHYGKLIKSCFKSNKNKILTGADFTSLESVINALLTKDPNKLRPLIEGIDSHSFNAYGYYPHKFPGIIDTPESLNTIPILFKKERQDSKSATFALQYAGTWHTLVNNCGIPEEEAKLIENNYHKLYAVSDEWVKQRIEQATIDGYVTSAFGLRLRTPILKKCMLGFRNTPYEAKKEARTAGNMIGGQAYGLLTLRALIEFMQRVWDSEYKYDISIASSIHDAIYPLISNRIDVLAWVNKNLIECMQWDGLEEIKHPTVKIGAELEVFYSWDKPIKLNNGDKSNEIFKKIKDGLCGYKSNN